MKQHNSDRSSQIQSRIPIVLAEGRRVLRSSTRKAGEVAGQVARKGRRIAVRTVHQTELMTKRNPWVGLGAAACTGLFLGAIATWLFNRD
jgi:ElaB/YqjD/DUF883 family membrane-anchored ribosome-binding protein